MLGCLIAEGNHVEGFELYPFGDVVGAGDVVAGLAPFVSPGEDLNGHIGHHLEVGNLVGDNQSGAEFIAFGAQFGLPSVQVAQTQGGGEPQAKSTRLE